MAGSVLGARALVMNLVCSPCSLWGAAPQKYSLFGSVFPDSLKSIGYQAIVIMGLIAV